MRRRIPICCVLVGWEDAKTMVVPIKCGKPASKLFMPYKVPACAEHVKMNVKKGLTFVPPCGVMIGCHHGSRFEPI